jgi:hypothetical protein
MECRTPTMGTGAPPSHGGRDSRDPCTVPLSVLGGVGLLSYRTPVGGWSTGGHRDAAPSKPGARCTRSLPLSYPLPQFLTSCSPDSGCPRPAAPKLPPKSRLSTAASDRIASRLPLPAGCREVPSSEQRAGWSGGGRYQHFGPGLKKNISGQGKKEISTTLGFR